MFVLSPVPLIITLRVQLPHLKAAALQKKIRLTLPSTMRLEMAIGAQAAKDSGMFLDSLSHS